MSKTSKGAATVQPKEEKKYPTSMLLKSKHLAGYQRDFAKVILTEPEYTISEAKGGLDRVLNGGE